MSRTSVYFAPDFSQSNPYQQNLSDALKLQSEEIELVGLPLGRRSLIKLLAKKIDVLHLHWPGYYFISDSRRSSWRNAIFFRAILTLLKLRGTKIVWTVHNIGEHDSKQPDIEDWFMTRFVNLTDHMIVHCHNAYDLLCAKYSQAALPQRKVTVIPHGHYIDNYAAFESRKLARSKLNLDENSFLFLFLGQIRPYKGVEQLLSAFNRLGDTNSDLLIAGHVSEKSLELAIESAASETSHIIFRPGFVEDKLLPVYCAAADVIVFPYQSTLTSGGIVLAMSLGRPCIAPRMGCITEMLGKDGGFLYNHDDPQGLYNSLIEARSSIDALQEMGRNNLERAKQWDWHGIGKKTHKVYVR